MKRLERIRLKSRSGEAWLLLVFCAVLFLLALLLPLRAIGLTQEEDRLMQACRKGEVIRLHILAEDDSAKAQAIKLAVRDAVLEAYGDLLASAAAASHAEAYALLLEKQEEILSVAQAKARACGFEGSVTAEVGWLHLPQKRYGRVLLPEGEYRALRITLGRGEGQNWWCILFPSLCLALAGQQADEPVQEPERWVWHSLHIFSCWPVAAP